MEDTLPSSGSGMISEVDVGGGSRKFRRCFIGVSHSKAFSRNAIRSVTSLRQSRIANGAAGQVTFFLLKIIALEMVRRFSKSRCPFAWRGLQALQVLCYPPFKWIQRWAPFSCLVKGMQVLSKPLLVLSIATSLSDRTEPMGGDSDDISDSPSYSEMYSELSSVNSSTNASACDEPPQSIESETLSVRLSKELESQGFNLPERLNEEELQRFFAASNGDFTSLLSSIKKTIRWRENYKILSSLELDMWSHMVFWHGFDLKHRPCLIVRLGLACMNLSSEDRPRFIQAIVSQVEHGIVELVDSENPEDPQITVLVDCEGLTPFRVPMQMMRYCSSLLQDHFPNRLGCLFIIRLPPVVRLLAQTFIQILTPVTRKKLKIEGETTYKKVLSEYIQTLPRYLGGKCSCSKCSKVDIHDIQRLDTIGAVNRELITGGIHGNDAALGSQMHEFDNHLPGNFDQMVRTSVISILMFWAFIAVIVSAYDPENRIFFPWV
ncbi:uncharacterized protein LOC111448152 isoform X1 [Cucurbita moschata]|uniref:Uncharacterized protein LOC111448152 isoform X1 n=1 Tax=Cucurbita moschata TaxID=3662 RepID=A0A6J1FU41_CUCMO|nr:uncharacterized protein LOC111448152 isoform X1 [Cucurbita moschata]